MEMLEQVNVDVPLRAQMYAQKRESVCRCG